MLDIANNEAYNKISHKKLIMKTKPLNFVENWFYFYSLKEEFLFLAKSKTFSIDYIVDFYLDEGFKNRFIFLKGRDKFISFSFVFGCYKETKDNLLFTFSKKGLNLIKDIWQVLDKENNIIGELKGLNKFLYKEYYFYIDNTLSAILKRVYTLFSYRVEIEFLTNQVNKFIPIVASVILFDWRL